MTPGGGGQQQQRPRPPRPSSAAAATWKVDGNAVRRSSAQEAEEASRMPRTDSFQRYGTLTLQCFDRLSRKPLPGCAVCVSRIQPSKKGAATPRGRARNAASTFGQATVSDEDVSPPSKPHHTPLLPTSPLKKLFFGTPKSALGKKNKHMPK
jgi:hypothetical protein